jgi:beta-mannosidase
MGADVKSLELSGTWQLAPVTEFPNSIDAIGNWLEMDVPSHWQQHPELESHSGKVVYKKTFSFKPKKTALYRLVLPGIFYWSAVYLNGTRLGDHEGYFSAQTYDVTEILAAKNELVVYVNCPDEKEKNNKRMITGVFSHWDCIDPETNPGGIWLAPEIHEAKKAFIDWTKIHTAAIVSDHAVCKIRVDLTAFEDLNAKITATFTPATFKGKTQTFTQDGRLNSGANSATLTCRVEEPKLWWTHDLGSPDLYDVQVSVTSGKTQLDTVTETVGIRTIEVRDWIFHLNGRRLYIKGNNYAPADTRIATITRELVEKDLELAKGCHMNLLRVHAHVDHPELYFAADRAGVLIWQDFPLQWSYQRDVLPIAKEQIAQMVRLLFNRPSVAMWCCHNEAIHVVDTKSEDFVSVAKVSFSTFAWSWNRDVMDVELQQIVNAEDHTRFCNRSSGEPALFKSGADTHFYFGWYRVMGPKMLLDKVFRISPKNVRFVSEFGAQSLPNLESSVKFMDQDIRKIDWHKLETRHSLQVDLLDHWVGRKFDTLAELVDASQEYQSRINQYYIDRIRARKYNPGGGLAPFMFTDSNPAILWSIVDYWRQPKASYYAMKKAFSPQYVFALHNRDEYKPGEKITIKLMAVNDAKAEFDKVDISYVLTGPDGGIVTQRDFNTRLVADGPAIEIAKVEERLRKIGNYSLNLRMTGEGFELENDYPIVVAYPS